MLLSEKILREYVLESSLQILKCGPIVIYIFMDWMFVSSKYSYVEITIVMVLEVGLWGGN